MMLPFEFELKWLKKINFFPVKPKNFGTLQKLCLGTKTRTIGDALSLTSIPRKLKQLYPDLKITTYPRGFNPVAFQGNPYVNGVSYLPTALYGDDCDSGSGHVIQVKEQYFDLATSQDPRPEIYLLDQEKKWAEKYAEKYSNLHSKPRCFIHPWGKTQANVVNTDFWTELIKRWNKKIEFWQVGLLDHEKIPGCTHYLFTSKKYSEARKLFSLFPHSQFFIGVDSGPMHIAQAFSVPSLILLADTKIPEVFENRWKGPYYLFQNYRYQFLYEMNTHLSVHSTPKRDLHSEIDAWIQSLTS